MKPITIYWKGVCTLHSSPSQKGATNTYIAHVPKPSKVVIILVELRLPLESNWVEPEDLNKKTLYRLQSQWHTAR